MQEEKILEMLATIHHAVVGVQTDVAELKTDVAGLKKDVAELKTDVAGLKKDVAELKTDVAVLKTDVADLKNRVTKLEGDMVSLKAGVNENTAMIRAMREAQEITNANIDALMIEKASRKQVDDLKLSVVRAFEAASQELKSA